MTNKFQAWLKEHSERLRDETLRRALNLLPDEEAVDGFLLTITAALSEHIGGRLRLVQSWANENIGADIVFATDWLTVLRTVKEVIGDALLSDFPNEEALAYYREADRIITYAIIEVTRLSSDPDREQLLEHMVDLRERMARLDRNKASFIKVAAHELRTPLTILEGYASMMRAMQSADPAQLGTLLDGFESGIARLRNIIGDMIDVTMIDSESIDINYQPMFLDKLLKVLSDNLKSTFAERQVTLSIDPMVISDPLYGDPERLYQVFEKIITNSLKYTPDGGEVSVRSHLTRPGEDSDEVSSYIVIEIMDNGIGIDPENLERIFEVFSGISGFSLHSSSKTKFKGGGAGLGLPIARGIVEAHGGRIWADSIGCNEQTCPGSTFFIELPVRTAPPGATSS